MPVEPTKPAAQPTTTSSSTQSTSAAAASNKPKPAPAPDNPFDRSPPPPDDDFDDVKKPSTQVTVSKTRVSLVDDLATNDVDLLDDEDIFAATAKPKTKKKAKEESIFDDPLNLFSQ